MKKERLFTKRSLKTVVAFALAAALAIPATSNLKPVVADDAPTAATQAVPKRLLDFNEGLKEYNSDTENYALEIVAKDDMYVYKTAEEIEGTTDRLDANGLLIMGNGSGAYYKKYTVSNQPSTYHDDQRGTVLYMGKTVTVDAVKKEKSAGIENDNDATATLDKECPIPEGEDKTIQPAVTVRSELNFKNPIADSTSKFTVSMWIKIPAKDGITNELAGAWHYVTVTVDGENAVYYLDGAVKDDANVISNIKAWIASGDKLSIGGDTDSAKAFAAAFGIVDGNAEIMLDDIAFYTDVLTAENVDADYKEATKEIEPVAKKLNYSDFKDISKFTNKELYPGVDGTVTTEISLTSEAVNAQEGQEVIFIPENKKTGTSTGAFIANPFAGKELEGATISFWTKQDKRSSKGSDGTETTSLISFVDTVKTIDHKKSDAKGEAWSKLSVESNGNAAFKEAFSDDGIGNRLKNTYAYNISEKDRKNYSVNDWYYVTLVMNNAGLKMYINGVLYENATFDDKGKSIAAGARFLDGYFQREDDEKDVHTRFNVWGGDGNQYATTLMSYLKSSDITLFLGYVPNSSSLNVKTNPSHFSGIRVFDVDLKADQVKKLYENNAVYDDKSGEPGNTTPPSNTTNPPSNTTNPPDGETKLGDVNLNGEIELADASLALKAALGIEALDGQKKTNADVDKNGDVTLEDVVKILKAALGIGTL